MAVGEHITTNKTISSRGILICIDKAAEGGVVIAGLEVIEAGLLVVVVALKAQGIAVRDVAGVVGDGIPDAVADEQGIAEGVVLVLRRQPAVPVRQGRDVPLEVQDVVVGGGGLARLPAGDGIGGGPPLLCRERPLVVPRASAARPYGKYVLVYSLLTLRYCVGEGR